MSRYPTFAAWEAAGEWIAWRDAGGTARRIWVFRRPGSGPHVTLLHGFPTQAFDWAAVADRLGGCDLLAFDFLGFGSSDKPAAHDYSLHEQADLAVAVWAHAGVTRTAMVAHDYAVSVAQELLARRAERRLAVELAAAVFLNGGLYPDLHRPLPVQTALLDPEQGPRISALVSEEALVAGLRATFGERRMPSDAAFHEMWNGIARQDGHRLGHRLIHYMRDRAVHAARWTTALEQTDVPRRFVWGMLDPVSGAHVVPRLRQRLPDCPLVCLDDAGHWPAIEAPDTVAAQIAAATGRTR
jgi:pimeloyl-ACP methyl ester carboxylesterase